MGLSSLQGFLKPGESHTADCLLSGGHFPMSSSALPPLGHHTGSFFFFPARAYAQEEQIQVTQLAARHMTGCHKEGQNVCRVLFSFPPLHGTGLSLRDANATCP